VVDYCPFLLASGFIVLAYRRRFICKHRVVQCGERTGTAVFDCYVYRIPVLQSYYCAISVPRLSFVAVSVCIMHGILNIPDRFSLDLPRGLTWIPDDTMRGCEGIDGWVV
jgi:hypothetical protein